MPGIVILGAGTAGTLVANKLARRLRNTPWKITVIDSHDVHVYQPGLLFVPFGRVRAQRLVKHASPFLPKSAEFIVDRVTGIDPRVHQVIMASGPPVPYDILVVATGTTPRPDLVPGLADGPLWRRSIFDFYTVPGATALASAIRQFRHGRIVVQVTEMPIKCPVAPLEFALLAQDHFRKRGRTPDVDIAFVTPLDGAFTKPTASKALGSLMAQRGIEVVTDFQLERVDNDQSELVSYDGRTEPFDLLVTVPPNRGSQVIADSGLGDDSGFVPVDKHTLQSLVSPDVWAIGDATNAPTSKAGSVAHFMADALVPNILDHIDGRPPSHRFDGHANCFIESGRGRAMLLDFNYDQEPVTGVFPVPRVGPLSLLRPSVANHASKLAFEPVYWEMLIRGLPLPFPTDMPIAGKDIPAPAPATAAPHA